VVKEKLCMWLEDNWDHKFLAWDQDDIMGRISDLVTEWDKSYTTGVPNTASNILSGSIVWTPFNPTAENMAQHLVEVLGPLQLAGTGVVLQSVRIEETAKCSASYSL